MRVRGDLCPPRPAHQCLHDSLCRGNHHPSRVVRPPRPAIGDEHSTPWEDTRMAPQDDNQELLAALYRDDTLVVAGIVAQETTAATETNWNLFVAWIGVWIDTQSIAA